MRPPGKWRVTSTSRQPYCRCWVYRPTARSCWGRDLLSNEQPLVVFRDGGFIAGDRVATGPSQDRPPECFQLSSGASIACERLAAARSEARRHMEISDLVVRGNLIRRLRAEQAH